MATSDQLRFDAAPLMAFTATRETTHGMDELCKVAVRVTLPGVQRRKQVADDLGAVCRRLTNGCQQPHEAGSGDPGF
jgi:hypothetical protein